MATTSLQHLQFERRKHRTRTSLAAHQQNPRLSVHRTLRHIFAQIIDDNTGRTLASSSDHAISATGTKTEVAMAVGKHIAELAATQKITAVRFDRGGFKYHGRVAALAAAARDGGLIF